MVYVQSMETLNSNPETQKIDVESSQFKVLKALVELDPREPVSASRIALHSGLTVKDALVTLTCIAESDEGLLEASYLYRNTEGSYEVYDKDTAYRKIQAGELDLGNLWPRFETTQEFRRQVSARS